MAVGTDGRTIQTNAKSNMKNFQNFSYFLGGIDDTHQNLDKFTPYIPGVSRIFLYKKPHYMNVMYPNRSNNFKTFMEAGYTSIQGIGDMSTEFTEFEGGFAAQKFSTVQSVSESSDTLSISVYELTGSPIREYLDTWITGVRDPRSGIAHYHGAIKANPGVTYGEINHTAEWIYTTMDPTGLDLEYTCMWAHSFPGNVPKSHLNYSSGERDKVSMELEFRSTKYESPAINTVGDWYLQASQVEYNYLYFNPNITRANVNINAIPYGNSSGNARN